MEDESTVCSNCGGEKSRVQVLTPEERENFQGLTISQEPERNDDGYYEYKSAGGRRRVYMRQVNLGRSPAGLLTSLFIGVVILGLVILFLPLALLVIGILVLGWLLSGFRGR
jgi:hypothetical protein